MKKVTFTNLKKYARRGELTYRITSEFDGMTDGKEGVATNPVQTTLEDLAKFKVSKNFLGYVSEDTIRLSNCCWTVIFKIEKRG